MGDYEVTPEEIVQIATGFLLSSPPGEFMEVVTDVRTLLGQNESLINATAAATFREYNTDQMIVVDSPAGGQSIICKPGEVSDNEYIDPKGGQVLTFDHIKQEVSSGRGISGENDSSVESLRQAVEKEANDYCRDHYPNGTIGVYGKNGNVIVCISSAKFNPNNFWNGRWRSTWTITPGAKAQLEGKMYVNVHYYEDGNVQLTTSTTKKIDADGGDDATLASNALKAIKKTEQTFHSSLDTNYATMGDTTFKALRRALPITRTKVNWEKILHHKIGGELGKK